MRKPALFYTCDFCLKSQDDVKKIVAAENGAAICNDCTMLAYNIVTEAGNDTDFILLIDGDEIKAEDEMLQWTTIGEQVVGTHYNAKLQVPMRRAKTGAADEA